MDSAREKLVTDNMRFARYMAKKFLNTGIEYEELVSLGYLGLVQAAARFDEDRGAKFVTLAGSCIQNTILQEARRKRYRDSLISASLDAAVIENDRGEPITLGDVIPSEETGYWELEANDWCKNAAESKALTAKERDIMILYLNGLRQQEISNTVGVSQSYVSRLVRKASRKLYRENLVGGVKHMELLDVCAVVTVVCLFLAMMLYEVGMFCTATVLCVVGIICVVLAFCSCASGRRKRKRR